MSVAVCAQKPQNLGAFKDSVGKVHPWSVTPSHSLIWDGATYMPVGGIFASRYLGIEQSDANFSKDIEALDALKNKGLVDIIFDPYVSLIDIPVASIQKFLDALEVRGFRYGLGFGTGITMALSGYVIKPTNYRIEDIRNGLDLTWNISNADSAYYVLVDGADATGIQADGLVRVRDNSVSVTGKTKLGSGTVAILYPHKTLKFNRDANLPDLWSGFDRYRDKMMTILAQIKFGPGLRFFFDPLTHPIGFTGEAEYTIPDSAAFRLEFEAMLSKDYLSIDDLMTAWSVTDRSITDFKMAARLIPLSVSGRGVPFLFDSSTSKRIETRGGDKFWLDMRKCRNEGIAYYMNAISDVLKREVADVPVVYTRTQQHSIFTNNSRGGGFDGLGMVAYGRGSAIVTSGADSVYSQIEEASKPIWCVVTETMDTSSPLKSTLGYSSRESLFYDLDWLRGVGAKGFFVNGLQVLPDVIYKNFQLVKSPDQLTWLKDYSDRTLRTVLNDSKPTTLPYPAEAAGIVHAGPIGTGGVWWMPSLATGKVLNYGSAYAGYTILQPGGEIMVLWTVGGSRLTHLKVLDPKKFNVTTVDGQSVPFKDEPKKHVVALTVTDTPIILRGFDADTLPVEAVEDAVLQLKTLVVQAEKDKMLPPDGRYMYTVAADSFKRGDIQMAMTKAFKGLSTLVEVVQPYTWIEAEYPTSHTLSEVVVDSAASGNGYMTLNTEAKPGPSGYGAVYRFNVPMDETYTVWAAVSPTGPTVSPFVWVIDQGQPHSISEGVVTGSSYMSNQFGWYNLGRLALTRGSHTLTIRVTDVAQGTGKFQFSADAFLVTRNAFTPNGVTHPKIVIDRDAKLADEKEEKKPKKKKKPQ